MRHVCHVQQDQDAASDPAEEPDDDKRLHSNHPAHAHGDIYRKQVMCSQIKLVKLFMYALKTSIVLAKGDCHIVFLIKL